MNTFNSPRHDGGVLTQKTHITFNKGGNWRLLEAPEHPGDGCQDDHVRKLIWNFRYNATCSRVFFKINKRVKI